MSGTPVTLVKTGDPPTELGVAANPLVVSISGSGAAATQVEGTAADGAAATGNPVQIGGVDGSGNAQAVLTDTSGRQQVVGAGAAGAAVAGNPVLVAGSDGTNALTLKTTNTGALTLGTELGLGDTNGTTVNVITNGSGNARLLGVAMTAMDGTNFQRVRTAGIGNAVASTGVLASGAYGEYLTNANQIAQTTGQYSVLQQDAAGNLRTAPQRPTASDILSGYLQHTSTTSAATVITVPAGRTFVGTVAVSVAASKAAAATGNGLVSALIATAGPNVTPAAGTIFAVSTRIGANAAAGTAGTNGSNFGEMPITVVAPAGNTVTVTLASTLTSITEGAVDCSIFGVLQ